MSIEDLKKQFIIDDDALKSRLEPIIPKVLTHCVIDRKGLVHVTTRGLPARSQVMLTLSARAIGSELDPSISATVPIRDISLSTGLPEDQIRARARDLIEDKSASSPEQGHYRAAFHKIEAFLDELPNSSGVNRTKTAKSRHGS